jgi:hypothetical protein
MLGSVKHSSLLKPNIDLNIVKIRGWLKKLLKKTFYFHYLSKGALAHEWLALFSLVVCI